VIALGILVACSSSTPPPGPERSPSPTIPSCLTDADCSGGEECRDGVCVRPGNEYAEDRAPPCPAGCPVGHLCMNGHCVDSGEENDAGVPPPCGGCLPGRVCDEGTGLCIEVGAHHEHAP
jgi:hypothetical protein